MILSRIAKNWIWKLRENTPATLHVESDPENFKESEREP